MRSVLSDQLFRYANSNKIELPMINVREIFHLPFDTSVISIDFNSISGKKIVKNRRFVNERLS